MSLAPLSLDTLTFEDLRALALRQAPIASGGQWTHHAAVDPGITLLELFAFLLDQQLFVMDQLSADMQRAIMALLGDAPRPAGVARMVVAMPEASLISPAAHRAGDVLVPADGGPATLAFSLADDVLLLPVMHVAVAVAGIDRTPDLRQGRPVALFAGEERAEPDLVLTVTLASAIPASLFGREVAIALLLDDDGAVAPEWSDEAVDVPPPVALSLQLDDGLGRLTAAAAGWHDGTGGLRRSGLLRFAIPVAWIGRSTLSIALGADAHGHAEPPKLARVAVGAAIARHARPVRIGREDTGDAADDALREALVGQVTGWLPLSNRELALPSELYPVIENSLRLSLQDGAGVWTDWSSAGSLAPSDGQARAYVFDRDKSLLRFGDGYNGRIPAPATNAALDLEVGGGVAGNHPAGLQWRFVAGPDVTLVSLSDATGGHQAESLDAARRRIAGDLPTVTRAVTAKDHEELVEHAPGLARHRASVAPGFDPAFPCAYSPDSVTIFVVPVTGETAPAPRPDEGALVWLRARLDDARLLTTRTFVEPATIHPVEVTVELEGISVPPPGLSDLLHATLGRYLHPALGGAEGTGWPFGHPLRPSELMRVVDERLPQGARVASVAIRLLDDPGRAADACSDTPIGPHELVWLASFRLAARTDAPVGALL